MNKDLARKIIKTMSKEQSCENTLSDILALCSEEIDKQDSEHQNNLVGVIQDQYEEEYQAGASEQDIIEMLKTFRKEEIATFDIEYFCDWLWDNN
jgi:hypothetical protein